MNFLQLYREKWAKETEPPVDPPSVPEESPSRIREAIAPIKIDLEQYAQLTRALRPYDSLLREEGRKQHVQLSPTLQVEPRESVTQTGFTIPFDLHHSTSSV